MCSHISLDGACTLMPVCPRLPSTLLREDACDHKCRSVGLQVDCLLVAVHTVPPDQVRLIGSTGLDSRLVLAERSVKERVGVLRDSACGLLRTVLHTR